MDWLVYLGPGIGLGGVMMLMLFIALRRGDLWTQKQVDTALKAKDDYAELLREQIGVLRSTNEKLDERNDKLAQQIGGAIEVARSTGMVQALPSEAAERLTR